VTGARDERPMTVRLKTKKKRTVSQKRWLERQLNDPYVARAKREFSNTFLSSNKTNLPGKHPRQRALRSSRPANIK
jgi:hypothetical protein